MWMHHPDISLNYFICQKMLVRICQIREEGSYVSRLFSCCLQERLSNCLQEAASLQETCLHKLHLAHGAKMVPFAGWSMPVQYKEGIGASHIHVREHVGIFDVSHMLQTRIFGRDRVQFMESLTVTDVEALSENHGSLSLFTNEKGGIIDDLIIMKTRDYIYVVSNAGCAEKDLLHLKTQESDFKSKGFDVTVEVLPNALLAVQGPGMSRVLQPGVDEDLMKLPFMTSQVMTVFGIPDCRVCRCGYTGEDGVEISVLPSKAESLVDALLSSTEDDVRLIGLGARDSLRLEAGLCLYGNDITENITPIQASLTWVIGKRRRETADFPGADVILKQLTNKPPTRRVGFLSTGPPARGGTDIYDEGETKIIGKVTSGCPSPSLKQNVAMGYIDSKYIKAGTNVKFEIRKKLVDAQVSKMPFLPSHYYIPK